jgi:hypothetical protein
MPVFHESVLRELLDEKIAPRHRRQNPRGVRRQRSSWPTRKPNQSCSERLTFTIKINTKPWVRPRYDIPFP